MTEAAQRKPAAKPARRLPVGAPVLWTGVALGALAAVVALTHGVMLQLFGNRTFLAGALNVVVLTAVFIAAGVVLAELTRRHHRAAARTGWHHGKRGTSAACRGVRRHGVRGAGFVAGHARARWTAWREVPDAPDETDPVPLSAEWGVPVPDPIPSPDPQSPNPTGGTTMTGTTQPATRARRTAANGGVPGAWGAVVAHTADFQAESDGDLLTWMRGEAMGAAAYAEALVEQYETCLNVIGVDPVAIQTLHDVADAATTMAATMAAAVKRFAEHYELPTQFVADGGLLAHDGRWHKGDAD
jgi:hypothetical protein